MKKRKEKRPFNSTLPVWIIERGKAKGTLNIECPRSECGGKAVVSHKRWVDGPTKDYIGRSCTYCFRTCRLPVRYMPEKLLMEMERTRDE